MSEDGWIYVELEEMATYNCWFDRETQTFVLERVEDETAQDR